MNVFTVTCRFCRSTIYSRAPNDTRKCDCQRVGVTGGPRNFTVIGDYAELDVGSMDINATEEDLYLDWDSANNKYGIIHG